jgi:hypothetical protein
MLKTLVIAAVGLFASTGCGGKIESVENAVQGTADADTGPNCAGGPCNSSPPPAPPLPDAGPHPALDCGTSDGPTCLCSPGEVSPCPCPSDAVPNCLAVGACTGTQVCSPDGMSLGACACSAGGSDAGIAATTPDAGPPSPTPDAAPVASEGGLSQCPGYAAPSDQASCNCNPATSPCSANGCYNGYYCRLSDQTCQPKPAGC